MKSARSSEIKERSSEVEDASSHNSEKLAAPFSKEPFPFSKAGLDSAITWHHEGSVFPVCRHSWRAAWNVAKTTSRTRFWTPVFKRSSFQFVVTRRMRSQLRGNYGSFVRKRVTGTVHPSTGCRQIVREQFRLWRKISIKSTFAFHIKGTPSHPVHL